ncbi:chemotaxis protein CheA [Rhizobium wenxiniae]|uniref:chemotaxis protein CheA n=1 Tax=Rhizobium wenxiniae TaxID=1737357 RepID=UPI001C6F5D21|nr:chemotaxis protein CheA [Rhizobium wenxiniae]MBW9091664.1 chemotaxis protein CheA [Rhizobium wenxiniae]
MDELIEQFAIEARELVQQASDDLMALEADAGNREHLKSAFRAIHTLKGSVGLFELGPMQDVLHHAEDLLSQARAGTIAVDATFIDPLLSVVEWVDDSIDAIVETGHLSDAHDKQATRLLRLLNSEMTEREADEPTAPSKVIPNWALLLAERLPSADTSETTIAIRYEPHPECFFNGDDPLATISRLPDLRHLSLSLRELTLSLKDYDPFRCNVVIEAISGGPLSKLEAAFRLIPDQVTLVELPQSDDQRPSAPTDTVPERLADRQKTMRVDSARIDRLIEIAGELVTAKNGLVPLAEQARGHGDGALARSIGSSHEEIERLVASLYSAVTHARMIPLEHTFRRFPRLVRETSMRLGKTLDLVIEGETVEADREIVGNLFEPLLHLIRNGLDHGIEPEGERLQFSKPARGRILLRARKRGDQIEIDVIDDGRGMDLERIRKTAVDRGLMTAAQAAVLPDREAMQLVFAPGFSTASDVSDLSGRGVGLDVVQRSIQRLGGILDIQSALGSGTTFTFRVPISFSMTKLMVVEAGGERYGIPISDILETQKLPSAAVQPIRAGRAFILRDRTIPLLDLADLLKIPRAKGACADLLVLVVRAGDDRIGVVVDAIAERTETLTRPLSGVLQGVPGIAGTTLLGDGRVLLVLDLEELIK